MAFMDETALARVDRLVEFCKRRGVCLDDSGAVSPHELAQFMESKRLKGSYQYWRDILAKQHRSFGANKAREVESALGMAYLYLDGGADWPFEYIDYEKVRALKMADRLQLEGAIRAAAKQLAMDVELGELPHAEGMQTAPQSMSR